MIIFVLSRATPSVGSVSELVGIEAEAFAII